jgi:hypothetical protein
MSSPFLHGFLVARARVRAITPLEDVRAAGAARSKEASFIELQFGECMQKRGEQMAFSVGVETDEAFVTAVGVGSVAREMVRLARRYGVPIVRNDGAAHQINAQVNQLPPCPVSGGKKR